MICKFCCGGPTLLVQKEYEINTRFEGWSSRKPMLGIDEGLELLEQSEMTFFGSRCAVFNMVILKIGMSRWEIFKSSIDIPPFWAPLC